MIGWLLVIGCWLLVIGYWLLVIGYWLLVIGYWLLVIGDWFVIGWLLVIGLVDWSMGDGPRLRPKPKPLIDKGAHGRVFGGRWAGRAFADQWLRLWSPAFLMIVYR